MPRFVFDTNVLINYIRGRDQEAHEALTVASKLGTIFISQITILEMWAPEKWKIKEKSPNLVPLWKRKLDEGEIPDGMLEVIIEQLDKYQQPIPNEFVLSTRSKRYRWTISDEDGHDICLVEYVNNSIIIRSADICKNRVRREILMLENLCDRLGVQVIPVSTRAQHYAKIIVQYHRDTLGKSVIPDSLVIATGLVRRAWLVTTDKDWRKVAQDIQNRNLSLPKMKVIDPIRLSREGIP